MADQLTALPWLETRTGLEITQWLDLSHLFELVRSNWERAGGVATTLLGYLSRSGFALLTLVANVALLPVLTYFFLRDWDVFVERAAALVPRDHLGTASRLARESSDILGAFLRGQFLVMLILGVLYGFSGDYRTSLIACLVMQVAAAILVLVRPGPRPIDA